MKNVDKQRLLKILRYSDVEFTELLRKILDNDTVEFITDNDNFIISYIDRIGVNKTHITFVKTTTVFKKLSECLDVEVCGFCKGNGYVGIEYIDNEREETLCYYIKCQAKRIDDLEKKIYQLFTNISKNVVDFRPIDYKGTVEERTAYNQGWSDAMHFIGNVLLEK